MDSKNRRRNSQGPKNEAIETHLGLLESRIWKLRKEQVESILNTLNDTFSEVQKENSLPWYVYRGSSDIVGVNRKY